MSWSRRPSLAAEMSPLAVHAGTPRQPSCHGPCRAATIAGESHRARETQPQLGLAQGGELWSAVTWLEDVGATSSSDSTITPKRHWQYGRALGRAQAIISPNPNINDESRRSFPTSAKDFRQSGRRETTPYTWSAIRTVYSRRDSRRRLDVLFFAGSDCRRPLRLDRSSSS